MTGFYFLSYDVQSQDGVGGGSLIVGGQGAWTNGYLTPPGSKSYDIRSGVKFGVFVEERVTDFLAVGSGFNMHYTGSNNVSTNQLFFDIEPISSTATNIDLRMTKMEIPLYAAIFLGNIKLFAGGSWNPIRMVEADVTEELEGLKSINPMDVTKRFSKDEFTLLLGVGYGINTGDLIVYPEIQYSYGLSDNGSIIGKSALYHEYLSVGLKIGLDIL